MYTYIYVYIHICIEQIEVTSTYGVASVSRLLKITVLFCKRAL